jgi:hypothetical protein
MYVFGLPIWAPKNNNKVVDKNRNIYASLNQYHNTLSSSHTIRSLNVQQYDSAVNKNNCIRSIDEFHLQFFKFLTIYIYYEFSLLHIFSLVIQPWMSAYIRKTDGVYMYVFGLHPLHELSGWCRFVKGIF